MDKFPPVLNTNKYDITEYPIRVQIALGIYNFFFIPVYKVYLYFTEKMIEDRERKKFKSDWWKFMKVWHFITIKCFLPFLSCLLDIIFLVPKRYW